MDEDTRHRAMTALLVALLAVVLLATGPVMGTPTSADGATSPSNPIATDVSALQVAQQNNSTTPEPPRNDSLTHHENPDEVSEIGDLGRVQSWLSRALVDRLSQSTVRLQQGEYEQARSIIGDRYNDRLDQFVDVIGETATDEDDGTDEAYRETQRSQRNLTTAVQEYERTYDEYQRAVEDGNETRARRKARELSEQADRVRRLNRTVAEDYRRLGNQTSLDLSPSIERITNVTQNISTRQSRVESTLFTGTTLEVEPAEAAISYRDPLVVDGRLVTAEGDPVTDREITVQVYTRERTVRTDGEGRFELTYRPRTIPVSRSTLRVTYRPAADSEYQASNDSVDVTIEQVTATLSASVESETVGYGDLLGVTASLRVDGEPVSGLPVRVTTGGYRVGPERTARSGDAELGGALPATVPPGERTLTVVAGNETTAVTAPNETLELTVRETDTTLSVARESASASTVTVGGRLVTVDGTPGSGQTVRIEFENGPTRRVMTDSNGTYSVTVDRDQLDAANDSILVTARYDGMGRNLNGSTAQERIDVSDVDDGGGTGPVEENGNRLLPRDGDDLGLVGGAVVAVLVLVLVGLVVARQYLPTRSGATGGDDQGSGAETGITENGDASGVSSSKVAGDDLDLAPGWSFLQAGDETAALQYTYQHLRQQVAGSFGVDRADTHWEFFDACRRGGMDGGRLEALRALVEAYETTAFGPESTVDDPESVIESVETRWANESGSGLDSTGD